MRAGVWKAAIVVAGVGLVVALAGWMGGEGHGVADQEAAGGREAGADAVEAGTQVEVVVHRVVPETSTYLLGEKAIFATRDEAVMLDGLRANGHELSHKFDSHLVWITLVNHTDLGYLLSERFVSMLARGGIGYADANGRAWRTHLTALGNPDGYVEAFTVPLAPNGRREMVLPATFMRFDPPEDPQRPGRDLAFPTTLRYQIRLSDLRARPIVDGGLGEPIELKIDGRGTCEVRFDGPM